MITDTAALTSPKTPKGFHAFLLADLRVEDSGTGVYVDVVFQDGSRHRARASAEVLRLGPGLRGSHRATLHFRTDLEGYLVEPLHLYRIREHDAPLDEDTGTYWSALGLTHGAENRLTVYPERARTTPFQVVFQTDRVRLQPPPGAPALHVRGTVRENRLVAVSMAVAEHLEIPHRWAGWREAR